MRFAHATYIYCRSGFKIKHRVQNPSRVTKPKSIATIHMCRYMPANAYIYVFIGLIASTVRNQRLKHCVSSHARHECITLFSFRAREFFDNSSLLICFRCLGARSSLPFYVKSICLCSPTPQRQPSITVKGISRTPHTLNADMQTHTDQLL